MCAPYVVFHLALLLARACLHAIAGLTQLEREFLSLEADACQ